jgi:hypothetical protein
MIYVIWILQLLLTLVSLFAAPVLMMFALPFAMQTTRESGIPCLPGWLSWLNTPDDVTGDQGMYEPQVADVYARFGWHVKTWYWLGIRNQLNGLFAALAPRTAAGDLETSSGPYPNVKDPYRPGNGLYTISHAGLRYFEFKAVGPWSATKCWQIGIGWKVHAVQGVVDQPIMFLLQIKPFVTIG